MQGETIPPTWAASRNLGNPPHLDQGDGHTSFCQWYVNGRANTVKGWWFVLPDYSIVVELTDGVCISWDGRVVSHCTSVPQCPHDVYALWCSAPKAVITQMKLVSTCKSILQKRALPTSEGEMCEKAKFVCGQKCLLYIRVGVNNVLKAKQVQVKMVHEDGAITVRENGGDMELSALEVHRYLTHNSYIGHIIGAFQVPIFLA